MMILTWFVGIVCILIGGMQSTGEANSLVHNRVRRHGHHHFHNKDPWSGLEGSLKHVSVGLAGVWGVNCKDQIYYREDTYEEEVLGRDWVEVEGKLVQVDVGDDVVWGVNSCQNIYYREGILGRNPTGNDWVLVEGSLKHVSVSQHGHVWGVNKHDDIYHRIGASFWNPGGDSWKKICGHLKQISVGEAGVWGVNSAHNIYYRDGTFGDPESDPNGTGWTHVDGQLNYISSAENVYGVNCNGCVFKRVGRCSTNPVGTNWESHQGSLKQIESFSLMVWGTNKHNNVYEKDQE
ncbi:uncharacterized protein [Asterias amurensis]|uniref:uncharacterized protein n=1 Tax=Asterias amurensis TaxID=7602 RepID=UPI003AB8A8F7